MLHPADRHQGRGRSGGTTHIRTNATAASSGRTAGVSRYERPQASRLVESGAGEEAPLAGRQYWLVPVDSDARP
jgi:hypothetical protein